MRKACGHDLINSECVECWMRKVDWLEDQVAKLKIDLFSAVSKAGQFERAMNERNARIKDLEWELAGFRRKGS